MHDGPATSQPFVCCSRWGRMSGIAALMISGYALLAGPIALPNASFETPSTLFVNTIVDSWTMTPRPDWYDESGGFMWDQLTGVFRNPAPTDASYIDNCDGDQALWLFAVPEVGLYQDLDAVFEAGKSYLLTVGVIGGGGGMLAGVTIESSLFYRDAASNAVVVGAATITNTPAIFTNTTHLIDFEMRLPTVHAEDPWAGRTLGVRLLSTVGFDLQGGYWDLDHARLTTFSPPRLVGIQETEGQIRFTLESEPGLQFELLASERIDLPIAQWTPLATLTNLTGHVEFTEPATNSGGRVYQARQIL